MSRKSQENPQLDMTPMIDVVFELIIFFVVTLTEAQKKDETIELEDGRHGIVLTPEELPPTHMQIDIASRDKSGKTIPKGRITMGDREITPDEIGRRVKERMRKVGEFPVLIRADFNCRHETVARVMNAVTAAGIWKISFMAVGEDKTSKPGRPGRPHLHRVKGK
ncbi:MAG: biopolymer transporter ExbD [Kiritimatiellae bacterium]|nr:biopolymer transporter ExbD [Kiritimatiellia bacterium]